MRNEDELLSVASRPRLTPVDVQQQQFKRSFRGYDEQEVDEFLDRVTEDIGTLIQENERLKEQARQAPTTPVEGGAAADASRAVGDIKRAAEQEAERIVRDAQARADAIVRDAEARASGAGRGTGPPPGGAGDAGHLSRFITRERAFLQELAALIQSHAEGVKSLVQEARSTMAVGAVGAPEQESVEGGQATEEAEASDGARVPDVAEDPDTPDASAASHAEAPPSGRKVIQVPEAPEDRAAAMTFGGAGADEESPGGRTPRDRRRNTDAPLGDLFWGED